MFSGKLEYYYKTVGLAAKVCQDVSQVLLNESRTYYLTLSFLCRKTHIVEILRVGKNFLPKKDMHL